MKASYYCCCRSTVLLMLQLLLLLLLLLLNIVLLLLLIYCFFVWLMLFLVTHAHKMQFMEKIKISVLKVSGFPTYHIPHRHKHIPHRHRHIPHHKRTHTLSLALRLSTLSFTPTNICAYRMCCNEPKNF